MRITTFKQYWDRFKYNRRRRELLINLFDEADEQVKFYLDEAYVNWRDCIPGVREFLQEIETKETEKQVMLSKKNTTENK